VTGKYIIYALSLLGGLAWQGIIAFTCSQVLSPNDGAQFLFLYSGLALVTYWDFGYGINIASQITNIRKVKKIHEDSTDLQLELLLLGTCRLVTNYISSKFCRAFLFGSIASAIALAIFSFRAYPIQISNTLAVLIVATAYIVKSLLDNYLVVFESCGHLSFARCIQGFCPLVGSFCLLALQYFNKISVVTISISFLLNNLIALAFCFCFLRVIFIIYKNPNTGNSYDSRTLAQTLSNLHSDRRRFLLPSLLSYLSSILIVPISFMLVPVSEIPILNNMLFLGRIISAPSTIISLSSRSIFASMNSPHDRLKFISLACMWSLLITGIFSVASLSMPYFASFFLSNAQIAINYGIPISWIFIYFINLSLISLVSPYVQGIWLEGNRQISSQMTVNIILDASLSLILGSIFGVAGILFATLFAGLLSIYQFSIFHYKNFAFNAISNEG